MQPDLGRRATDTGCETVLGQALLEGHLTALEAGLDRAAGPELETLVSATRCLAGTRTDATADPLGRPLRALSGAQ